MVTPLDKSYLLCRRAAGGNVLLITFGGNCDFYELGSSEVVRQMEGPVQSMSMLSFNMPGIFECIDTLRNPLLVQASAVARVHHGPRASPAPSMSFSSTHVRS